MPRQQANRFLFACLTIVTAWGIAPSTTVAQEFDASGLIFVSQDESSIEETIADYIEAAHGARAGRHMSGPNNDDLVLTYTISPGGDIPKLKMMIDTMVSGRTRDDNKVTSRVIKVFAYYKVDDLNKSAALRNEVRKLNDRVMGERWLPHRVHLDKENDIVMAAYINIPGSNYPAHAEMVHDLLTRMIRSWEKYYKELSALLASHRERGR
jgi:hypothetical protein